MLSPREAQRLIADSVALLPTDSVRLEHCAGRILRQSVSAERDQPPFDRVTMDGIAIDYATLAGGQREFPIAFTLHAGDPARRLEEPTRCAEVMTGSVLPDGADTVIPVERLRVDSDVAHIEESCSPDEGQFVHRRATDHRAGTALLNVGHRVTPLDVAIVASAGLTHVDVARQPSARIVSTGNELVQAGASIEPHQVRLSNGPALVAMLERAGFPDSRADHLLDDRQELEDKLATHLAETDVLILSGGVSMGKADFVPDVLAKLGVKKRFHRVSQRPGKPMWFGTGAAGQAVFALPGNPVSALVCCRHYVLPALFHASGLSPQPTASAVLERDVAFAPALTYFLPVRLLSDNDGRRLAQPILTNTSGDFTALSGTDGYVELSAEDSEFPAGTSAPFHRW
ncbi:MAG: molybdopterin molybdotransferase MoeA [Pseudomonadota bacterium]